MKPMTLLFLMVFVGAFPLQESAKKRDVGEHEQICQDSGYDRPFRISDLRIGARHAALENRWKTLGDDGASEESR